MATNYQMDPIIRRVDPSQRKAAEAEGVVVEVVRPHSGMLGALFADKWHYRLAKPSSDGGWARLSVDRDIDAPEHNWKLPITISMHLQWSGASEQTLINAVIGADNPDRGMTTLVNQWVDEFLTVQRWTAAMFIERFFHERGQLRAFLEQRLAQISLRAMRIDIATRGERPHVIELRFPHLYVVLNDYKPEVALSLDADLRLIEGSTLAYLPSSDQFEVERRVHRDIRELFRTSVTLHEWQFDLPALRRRVDTVIAKIAGDIGRETARLVVGGAGRTDTIKGAQRTVDFDIVESFKELDYPDPLEVRIGMHLDLVNLSAFVDSEAMQRGFEPWLREAARSAIVHHLLDEPYKTLFERFGDKRKRTEDALQAAAQSVGYRATRVLLQTHLDFDILQRGYECRIENASFALYRSDCHVMLDIDTRIRIKDEAALRDLFSKNTNIRQTITERVRSTVASELRKVSPEEFYLHFRGDERTSGESVAERLELAVRAACADFKPDEKLIVHFARQPDELREVYLRLQRAGIVLDGLVESNSRTVVDLSISVTRIAHEHWRRFEELKPTPEQVFDAVKRHVQSFLSGTIKREGLAYVLEAGDDEIKEELAAAINDSLGKEFGIGITVNQWRCHDDTGGKSRELWEARVEHLSQAVARLSAALANAYVIEDSNEITSVSERLEAAEQALDALYRQRGTRSIVAPKMTRLELPHATAKKALPDKRSDDADTEA